MLRREMVPTRMIKLKIKHSKMAVLNFFRNPQSSNMQISSTRDENTFLCQKNAVSFENPAVAMNQPHYCAGHSK